MITAEQFKQLYLDEDNEVDLPGKDCCYVSDEVNEHKTTYHTEVYQVGKQYFEITFSRSNSGYWSGSESYPPEVREVKPATKIITVYE